MFGRSKTCIACGEKLEDKEKYVEYDLKSVTNSIGKFQVHKKLVCHQKGATILRKQIEGSNSHNHTVVTTHIGVKYVYKLAALKKGYNFALLRTNQHGRQFPDKETFDFLKRFVYEKDLKFVILKNCFKDTPKFHLPILVSINDPIIPTGLMESEQYNEIMKNARDEFDTSMKIRGKDDVEAVIIMSNYVGNTSIDI